MQKVTQCPTCGSDLSVDAPTASCPRCSAVVSPSSNGPEPTQLESLPDTIFADQATEPAFCASPEREQPVSVGLPPSLAGYMVIGPPKSGGMGTVWPAKQLGTRRTVAIKILGTDHLTASGRVRFIREVELSAQLQHPNIARIYDSGIHQGDYFYAMEMIDGVPIDEYVAKNKLTRNQILALLRAVCDGVQHAHQRGVIHCDLKPDNILVTDDGQPHVLDFGLAQLTTMRCDGLTRDGAAPGTPSYMSPEQAAGRVDQIDTRSDVYSLGKIAYELLVGQRPHRVDGPIAQLLHRISHEDVRNPRQASAGFDWELSAVLLKALDRSPDCRYSSAGELARDIAHFQRGEPVAAIGGGIRYQLRKWIGRRRVPVAIAAAAIVLLIGLGIAAQLRFQRDARNQRLLNDFTASLLEVITPGRKVERDSITKLMEQGRLLSREFSDQPLMKAKLAEKMGDMLLSFGLLEPAEEQFREASTSRQTKLGLGDAQTLAVKAKLAQVLRERGKFREAEEICETVLRSRQARWGQANRETLKAAIALGQVLELKGLLGEEPNMRGQADKLLQETLAQCEASLGAEDQDTLEAKAALVLVLRSGSGAKLAEADRMSRETLEARQRTLGGSNRQTLESMHDRATVLAAMGSVDEAIELYEKAFAAAMRSGGWSSPLGPPTEDHPDMLIWWNDYAAALAKKQRYKEAQAIYDDILPKSIASRGEGHPFNVLILKNVASTLLLQDLFADAERQFEKAVRVHAEAWGWENAGTLNLLDYQGYARSAQRDWAGAAAIYQRTLKVREKKLAADDPELAASRKRLEIALSHLRPATSRPAR